MKKLNNSKNDNSKTQVVAKLKNSNCDKTQIVTKPKENYEEREKKLMLTKTQT